MRSWKEKRQRLATPQSITYFSVCWVTSTLHRIHSILRETLELADTVLSKYRKIWTDLTLVLLSAFVVLAVAFFACLRFCRGETQRSLPSLTPLASPSWKQKEKNNNGFPPQLAHRIRLERTCLKKSNNITACVGAVNPSVATVY